MTSEVALPHLQCELESGVDEEITTVMTRNQAPRDLLQFAAELQSVAKLNSVRAFFLASPKSLLDSLLAHAKKESSLRRPLSPARHFEEQLDLLLAYLSSLLAPSSSSPGMIPPTPSLTPLPLSEHLHLLHASGGMQPPFITTGCAVLDRTIGGGFMRGVLTEVAGEAGSGKSQLCLQSMTWMQQPDAVGHPSRTALYILTESYFPNQRFRQMQDHRCAQSPELQGYSFGSGICIETTGDLETFWDFLINKLPILLLRCPSLSLIVIDSLAALFRVEYSPTQSAQRAQALWKIATELKKIASLHQLAVVIVNQVTDSFHELPPSLLPSLPSVAHKQPSLGLAWSHCINVRINLARDRQFSSSIGSEEPADKKQSTAQIARTLTLSLSPMSPLHSCQFEITNDGVFGILEE